jgi:hypothetical protein
MNLHTQYSKQQVLQAIDNVLTLAHDQADMNKMHGFEDADDIIAEQSLVIVKHMRDTIKNMSKHEWGVEQSI